MAVHAGPRLLAAPRAAAWCLFPSFALLFGFCWPAAHRAVCRWPPEGPALPVPVVVVGNIAVGGTGKTPVALATDALRARGARPGIVSRGYGGTVVRRRRGRQQGSAPIGDEPVLMAGFRAVRCLSGGIDRRPAGRCWPPSGGRCADRRRRPAALPPGPRRGGRGGRRGGRQPDAPAGRAAAGRHRAARRRPWCSPTMGCRRRWRRRSAGAGLRFPSAGDAFRAGWRPPPALPCRPTCAASGIHRDGRHRPATALLPRSSRRWGWRSSAVRLPTITPSCRPDLRVPDGDVLR